MEGGRIMTSKQEALYWMKWRAACAAQGWDQKDSDRRHALHALALGQDKSHKDFTNPDFDRVLAHLNLQIDPNDPEARKKVEAYEALDRAPSFDGPTKYDRQTEADDPGERKRLIYRIRQLADAPYVEKVAFDRCAGLIWTELPIPDLTLLRDMLINNARARRQRQEIDAVTAEVHPPDDGRAADLVPASNCPF